MLRLVLAMAMGGASCACALAAVGWVLYAHSPAVVWVVQVFAALGFAAGLVCGALHLYFQGRPAPVPAALSSEAWIAMLRATQASAAAERAALRGSAADRCATAPTTVPTTAPATMPGTPPAPQPATVAAEAEATTP